MRARRASSSRCRAGSPASASIWRGSSPPAARSALAFAHRRGRRCRVARRPRDGRVRGSHDRRRRRARRWRAQVRRALAPTRGTSLLKVDLERVAGERSRRSRRSPARQLRPRLSRTRSASSSCPSGRSPSSGRAPTRTSSPRAAGSSPTPSAATGRGWPRIWVKRGVDLASGRAAPTGDLQSGGRGGRAARRLALPGPRQLGHGDARRADAPAALGARDPPRRPARRPPEAGRRGPGDPAARPPDDLSRRLRARAAGRRNPQLSGRG